MCVAPLDKAIVKTVIIILRFCPRTVEENENKIHKKGVFLWYQ